MRTCSACVTPEEIEMSGVMDWLDLQTGPVTREALAAFVAANGVTVEEVVKEGVCVWYGSIVLAGSHT